MSVVTCLGAWEAGKIQLNRDVNKPLEKAPKSIHILIQENLYRQMHTDTEHLMISTLNKTHK